MGILDKKQRIFDVILTDKGRNLLSKNQLNFSYFAFSDDGIDYSGSLADRQTAIINSGSSFDDYLNQNFLPFEAGSRNDKTLNNFLFTMPIQSSVVTKFDSSVTGSFTLKRKYEIDTIENVFNGAQELEKFISQENVLDYVVVVEEVFDPEERNKKFITSQFDNLGITERLQDAIKLLSND